MNYAVIEHGTVENIIWLYEGNASDFPNAVPLGDRPVSIGDSYADGRFSRSGQEVMTPIEMLQKELVNLAQLLSTASAVYTLLPESVRAIIARYSMAAKD